MNKMNVAIETSWLSVIAKRRIKLSLIYSLLIKRMILNNSRLIVLIKLMYSVNIFVKSEFATCI